MQVKVIGCSTAWTSRPMSSYCLDDEILIDCGEGTTKYYAKNNLLLNNIKNIFITHFHSDHCFGLVQYFCQHCIYNDKSKGKMLTIYGPKGLKRHLELLKVFAFGELDAKNIDIEECINIVELDEEKPFVVGDYKVKFYTLNHGNLTNLAYVFEKDGKSIGFSGDCTYSEKVEEFAKSSNLCFLECCSDKTSQNHLGYDRFVEIKNRYRSNRYIAIHSVDALYNNPDKYNIEFAIDGKKYVLGEKNDNE